MTFGDDETGEAGLPFAAPEIRGETWRRRTPVSVLAGRVRREVLARTYLAAQDGGESVAAIARRYGVTKTMVRHGLARAKAAKQEETTR